MEIRVDAITKTYPGHGKRAETTALDRASFTVPDGQLLGLLGPSGCGKSTALNIICGLTKPTSGRIYFGEEDVTDLEAQYRGVGMVFQSYALYPHMTVAQNIRFPLENFKGAQKLTRAEMDQRVSDAAKLVQIDEYMERRPAELSGGQQQRVAIARAMAKLPRVLLLDEPLSNLDARLRIQTRAEIRRIQQETGITTVFVTHDQEEAMSICDRIVVMERGVIQQIGTPDEIMNDPDNLFVAKFMGNPPIEVIDGVLEGGHLCRGTEELAQLPGLRDRAVTVGLRKERHTDGNLFIFDPETGERIRP